MDEAYWEVQEDWELRLHNLPRAELSGQNTARFCQQRETRGSGTAQRLRGRAPGADPPTDEERIDMMEAYFSFPLKKRGKRPPKEACQVASRTKNGERLVDFSIPKQAKLLLIFH